MSRIENTPARGDARTRGSQANRLRVGLQLLTPPILWRLGRRLRRGPLEGPLGSWEAAAERASGWDSPGIVEQALEAALKVRDGAAAFERDSVARGSIIYSPTILAALLLAADRYRALNIIDFGGGLGSNYFQNLRLISALSAVPTSWNVVERAPLARLGVEQFQTAQLRFHEDLNAVRLEHPVLLFTGSLQYVADAFALLEQVLDLTDIIALDRVLVWGEPEHAFFVQRLDARRFGPVTLPTWCFAKDALIDWFAAHGFRLVEHFVGAPRRFENCGMLFVRA
ncbi:MAG TPA: methyltransferase, TIGR04325 family [Caulobacteraceae bacterium]|nr:methyltransferase, TIGR04325 family [Caulobacteraceae bacterium]